MNKLMVIAGEASGDLHAGNVIRELLKLNPELEVFGTGGKILDSLGAKLYYKAEELAVIGVWEVLKHYGFFKSVFNHMVRLLDEEKPDAVLLVDYPGFNLRFAEEIKKRGIRVIYYIAPQVWSWKKNRIHKIKELVDDLVVIFPFEVDYFMKEAQIESHCFGHPLLDIAKPTMEKDAIFKKWGLDPDKKLVSILPGSRKNEVSKHLPVLIEMCNLIAEKRSDIQFAYPLAPTVQKSEVEEQFKDAKAKIILVENDTYNLVWASDYATVASGTASLETAILQTPLLIFYHTSALTYLLGKYLFKIDTIGLPNIVAQEKIIPEMIQTDFNSEKLAELVLYTLDNEQYYRKTKANLKKLLDSLGTEGGYLGTAEFINSLQAK